MTTLPADFVLPVDKAVGPTSHDVVRAARNALGRRRIGHTGTLDPFASGLLLLCVGRSTRLSEYLSDLDKTYEAVARLGQTTDTFDRDGSIAEENEAWSHLDATVVERVLREFVGEIEQTPPVYSAKKLRGEASHRRVRRGESVRLDPVRVRVDSLELSELTLPLLGFRVTCSSGTYVRALAHDIGAALGVGAHLRDLRRTRIGGFAVEEALLVDELADADRVGQFVCEPLTAVGHLPTLDVDDEAAGRLLQGRPVPVATELSGPVAVAHGGGLLAIGEWRGGMLKPRKVFIA